MFQLVVFELDIFTRLTGRLDENSTNTFTLHTVHYIFIFLFLIELTRLFD